MSSNKLDNEENFDKKQKAVTDSTEESDLESKSDNDLLLSDEAIICQPSKVQPEPKPRTGNEDLDPTCCILLSSCIAEFCNAILPFCVLGCDGCIHGIMEGMVACFESCGECCLMCQCVS